MKPFFLAALGAVALLAGAFAGLDTAGSARAATVNVSIAGFAFAPATLNAQAGDTVVWTNNDSVPHTATSDSGSPSFSTGQIAAGSSASVTFTAAGTYTYFCEIHPGMRGTIAVAAAAASPTATTTAAATTTASPAAPSAGSGLANAGSPWRIALIASGALLVTAAAGGAAASLRRR